MNTKHTVPNPGPQHEYEPGETVIVRIVAVVGLPIGRDLYLDLDGGRQAVIPLDSPDVQIERACPAQGEPIAGDLWGGKSGRRYFTFAVERTGLMFFRDDKGRDHDVREIIRSDGPLYLVHRDDAKAAGISDPHAAPIRTAAHIPPTDYIAVDEPASVARP